MTVFFPAIMTSGAIWYRYDAVHVSSLDWLPDTFLDSLIFRGSGAIGEYSVVLLVLGGVYLLLKNRISWHIPVALTVSFTVLFMLLPDGEYRFSLAGVLLGAIFMATDMPTSSSTFIGRLYYGAMIGAVAVMCIAFGVKHEYMSYSILLLNAFVVPVDWVFRPRVWGGKNRLAARIAQGDGADSGDSGNDGYRDLAASSRMDHVSGLCVYCLVHRWFFLASTPARCCCGMNNLFISELFSAYVL